MMNISEHIPVHMSDYITDEDVRDCQGKCQIKMSNHMPMLHETIRIHARKCEDSSQISNRPEYGLETYVRRTYEMHMLECMLNNILVS